jgi:hypothetical protein
MAAPDGSSEQGANPDVSESSPFPLFPQHLADLRCSGLSNETIRACEFRSSTDAEEIKRILRWKASAERLGPSLVIPFFHADGTQISGFARLKPDCPISDAKCKVRKYESPKGLPNHVYLPPHTRTVLLDPTIEILITEGEKKAAAADQHGFPCLGLVGVYGWKKDDELVPDLASVSWQKRQAFVVFDSDAARNPNVRKAERSLAEALRRVGARTVIVRLPDGPGGKKQGLDDFLVARGPDALRALLVEPTAPPDQDFAATLFRDEAELDRLARLKLDDPAEYEAERATLRKKGVPVRALDNALAPRLAKLRASRRANGGTDGSPNFRGYFVRDNMTFRTADTRDGPVEIALGNFAVRITAVTARDDGAEARRFFTVAGRTASGSSLPAVDVPADEFAGMTWVTGAWGNRPVVYAGQGNRDHLRVAIQILSGDVPERTVYAHLGWREVRGRWVYLHAGGAVGADGPDDAVEVLVDGPLERFCLPDPPTGQELVDSVRACLRILEADHPLAPDRVLVPVLGAVYRSVLGACDFGVHLFGRTGVMKSELAALAQQHFGSGLDARHLPANWASTPNAIEATAFAAKDALVVVDDFNPTGASDPGKLHATADRVFRGLGNGAGRNRLAADLSLRPPRPPRALILSTGEDVPRGHSLRARMPVVEVFPGDVVPARLSDCQRAAADGAYARALTGFAAWLAPRHGEFRKRLAIERATARDEFSRGSPHARTPAAIGDLWLGWLIYAKFAHEAGVVSAADRDTLLERVRTALFDLAAAQCDHLRAADPVDQFLRLLPAVLASGQAHLSNLAGGTPEHAATFGWQVVPGENHLAEWRARGNQIGWVNADHVYLIPDAALAEVQKLATAQREPITMAPRTLWARMHERRLLAVVDERGGRVRHVVRLSIDGERVACLQLRRTTLFPVQEGPDHDQAPPPDPPSAGPSPAPPRQPTQGSGPTAASAGPPPRPASQGKLFVSDGVGPKDYF